MEQTESSDKGKNALQHVGNHHLTHNDTPRRWPVVVATAALIAASTGGVSLILWAASAIDDLGVALTFIAQNILGLFVFLAILAQSYIYWNQRNLMRKQWLAMERQLTAMTDSLIETKRASKAAEDSATTAKDTLRISQRAYVGLQKQPQLCLQAGKNPEIEVYFVNTGRTPAHVVEFRYKFSSDKEGFGRSFIEYKGIKKDFFIFAGTPKTIPCVWNQQRLDDEWLQQIEDQSSTIYFTGRLAYEDVWGVSDNFKTDDVIRFEYFSFGTHELREKYQGDQDYAMADFVVEFDGTEEISDEPPWESEEPPDYEPYNPYDI